MVSADSIIEERLQRIWDMKLDIDVEDSPKYRTRFHANPPGRLSGTTARGIDYRT